MKCKCKQVEAILLDLANRQGQNKCWYNPEVLQKLLALFEIKLNTENLPPRYDFEEGCKSFTEELYGC